MMEPEQKKPEVPDDNIFDMKKPSSGLTARLITIIGIIICLLGVFYISNAFGIFGIYMQIVPYCGLILMFVLVLVFLIYPAKKGMPSNKVPWYDILFILMSVCGAGYVFFFAELHNELISRGYTTAREIVLCLMLVLVVLEAARRTIGIVMALIGLFFVIHLLFGSHFPGILLTPHFSLNRIASLFYLHPEGIFGMPVQVAATIIIAFMLFAAFLQRSDAGEFIIDTALALTGRWTGGPAKAAIVASSSLGTVVGATTANVATTGTITIPLMRRIGYKPEFAGAVEAVASNGGQIMPPVMGMVAFLIAELLQMPYWSVCVAAFVPAFIYFIALFAQVHLEAVKLGLRAIPKEQLPSLAKAMRKGWFYSLPIFILIYFLAVLHFPAQHCGLYTTLSTIIIVIIDWQRKSATRKGVKELLAWLADCMEAGARAFVLPAVACAAAGIIIGSLGASGLGVRISSIILHLGGENILIILVLTAITSLILGMGMSSVPCYLILAVLIAPALVRLGIEPIAAHLFVFYFGIVSFITPPVAVAAYIAAGIAGADPFKTGITAVRLGIVAFIVPFIFVYNPSLLLIGPIGEIILTTIAVILGVSILACGVEGFLMKELTWPERILFIAGAVLLMIPDWAAGAIGVAIIVPVLFWHVRAVRSQRSNWVRR